MPHPRRAAILAGAIIPLGLAVAAVPAVGTGNYPTWQISPDDRTAQVHTGTIEFGVLGFPASADFTVRKSADDGLSTYLGASDVIVAGTPWAQVFGPSTDARYLRVQVSRAERTVSTAHYVFSSPLPPGAWGVTLGDIDVDEAHIAASGGGRDLTGDEISGSVAAAAVPFNFEGLTSTTLPTWDPQGNGGTLTGFRVEGETEGDSGWFMPSRAVHDLTVRFAAQTGGGSPSYRTWFAVVSHPITGTVTEQGTGIPIPHALLTVEGPDGATLGVAVTDANGAYALPEVYAQPGYTVLVRPPAGYTAVGPTQQVVSTAPGPAVANFLVAKGTGGSGGEGPSGTASVVDYSTGDAAIVVTPGLQTARPGQARPIEIVTTCRVTTTATVPTTLSVVSAPGATRSGRRVTWSGTSGPYTLTVRPKPGRSRIARVPVATTCADGSTAAVTTRIRIIGTRAPVVPVTG